MLPPRGTRRTGNFLVSPPKTRLSGSATAVLEYSFFSRIAAPPGVGSVAISACLLCWFEGVPGALLARSDPDNLFRGAQRWTNIESQMMAELSILWERVRKFSEMAAGTLTSEVASIAYSDGNFALPTVRFWEALGA